MWLKKTAEKTVFMPKKLLQKALEKEDIKANEFSTKQIGYPRKRRSYPRFYVMWQLAELQLALE